MDQVYLGTDAPLTAGRGFLDLFNDILGGAVEISSFYDLAAAFWMDEKILMPGYSARALAIWCTLKRMWVVQ